MLYEVITDFCFVPAKSQYLEDVVREAINWLKTKRKWNLLILDDLHEKYPGNAIIREEIKSHFNSMIHQKGKYYFIDLHREWSDIERQISRKSVRRKCNALENKARNLEVLFNPDWPATKMAELISTMHTCRQEMLGRRPSYASEKQKLFLHTILAHNMTNKKLFTSWLLIDNEIAAYKIGFVENATYYAWNTAIDSRFLDLSVGKYLTFRLLKHLHREGVYEYNFMRGEGGEKDKWTPTTRVNNRYIVNNSYWWYARLIQIFDRSGHVQ